jgi:SAM-dependent methyltransferase
MHQSSYESMAKFAADYKPASVLDVGALDINGTYRPLFGEYVGLDLHPGKNVDVDTWEGIKPGSFDAVISGQTLEHTEDDAALVNLMAGALEPGGMCCIIVPSHGPQHCEPDYRRYTVESLAALVAAAGLEVVETRQSAVAPWHDVTVISRKPEKKKATKK